MYEPLEKIPAIQRWEIAAKALTGAHTALANAFIEIVGEEKYHEINSQIWQQGGMAAKEFANSLGMSADNAQSITEISLLFAFATMGPEFEMEEIESSETRYVGRTVKCPWHERSKEMGGPLNCDVGHQKWGEGVISALNPDFSFKLSENIPKGDSYCEWIIEKKT